MYALKAVGNIFLLIGKSHPIWYCGQCRNLIDDDMEDSIVCDSCLTWFHFHWISLKGPPKSKLWYCRTCYIITDKLWNFIAVSMITVHLSLGIFIEWVWFYFWRRGFDSNCWKVMSLITEPIGTAFKVWFTSSNGKVNFLLEKYKEVFTEKLGTMTQHMDNLHLKRNRNHNCWRPQPVTFSHELSFKLS